MELRFRSTLVLGVALIALTTATLIARRNRDFSARCGEGLEIAGARCCAPGQIVISGNCQGEATSCPPGMERRGSPPYCEALSARVRIAGGTPSPERNDWDNSAATPKEPTPIAPFYLDSVEYTRGRYQRCLATHRCSPLPLFRAEAIVEPGLPLTEIEPRSAEELCRAEGGRLPRGEEWMFAARGPEGHRFPWGAHGLVCRRAAFGLVHGPCAEGGTTPELSGARADGRTPTGIYDLAGNVAEWTHEPTGYVARGGSFRSELAAELKSGAQSDEHGAAPHIGFRCAYDNP